MAHGMAVVYIGEGVGVGGVHRGRAVRGPGRASDSAVLGPVAVILYGYTIEHKHCARYIYAKQVLAFDTNPCPVGAALGEGGDVLTCPVAVPGNSLTEAK